MKFCQSILFLTCAGWLLGGCASAPTPKREAKADASSATNAVADDEAADETPSPPALSTGRGNPESLAHYAAGIGYETNGQHDKAMEEFYKSVMADPGNEAEALELGKQYLQQQHPEKAVALLSKVAARPEASAIILTWLARADLLSGKTNDAAAVSRRAMERWPEALDGYVSQLEVLERAGTEAEKIKTLDRAAKHIRNGPMELISLANLYAAVLKTQDKSAEAARGRAVALVDRAAAMKISSLLLRERLADSYGSLGESKKASAIYAKLLDGSAVASTERDQILLKMALNYMDQKDWTNAVKEFQTVVHDDEMRFPGAWYYLGILAESDIKPGNAPAKLAEAADDFDHAIRWGQGPEMAYYRLALVKADLNLPEDALEVLRRARERFAVTFDSLFYTGLVNMRIKDFDGAVKNFEGAEGMARTNNPARLDRGFYFEIGAACERAHLYPRAATYLQKCIDMAPDDAESLNYLGFMWADRGENLAKARAYIEKAVKLDPKNAAYLDSLGWVLYKLKLPREALPWMLKAVEFSEEPDATILDHLGDVYLAAGQPDKAMENWKKSLTIEPNDDVKKKLRLFDAGAT